MEQTPKPKRVERIPIKRASYQKRIESVELSRGGSSRVVDLRSIAAKKEAQKRAEEQASEAARMVEQEKKARVFTQQVKKEKLHTTVERVPAEPRRPMSQVMQQHLSTVFSVFRRIKKPQRLSLLSRLPEFPLGSYLRTATAPVVALVLKMQTAIRQHIDELTDVQRQTMRSIRNFVVILCIVIIPATGAAAFAQVQLKEERLTQESEKAFAHMLAAGKSIQSLNFETSAAEFSRAKKTLDGVAVELDGFNGVLLWVGQWIPGKGQQAYAAGQLIDAGRLLAGSGIRFSEEAATIQATQENSPDELLQTITTSAKNLDGAVSDMHSARIIIDAINAQDIPEEKRAQLNQIQTVLPIFDDALQQGMGVTDAVLNVLGAKGDRKYIIVFQNNRELRPTGGFIGSLAIVTVRDGQIQTFDAPGGGVYDIAGQFNESVVSPKPLHLVNASWNLQDANWFPSFPDSAKKIQWFYERSNGATVDGVISITPDVLEKVMGVIGEVTVDDEGREVTVNAENVYSVLQSRDEEDLLEGAKPKTLIGNLTPIIMNRMIESIQDPNAAVQMLTILSESLDEKDILLTVSDPDVQSIFSRQGWTGEIALEHHTVDGPQDYLYVNHANIAGGKTDQVIEETIEHSVDIAADGSVVDTVTINRIHKGDPTSELESVKNNSYTRIYVPKGSELLTATGFETPPANAFLTPDAGASIDEDLKRISGDSLLNEQLHVSIGTEYEKTVIGGWMITEVGESSTVTLTYRLPFRVTMGKWIRPTRHYEVFVQKQPGLKDPYFVSRIRLPETMTASAWYPENSSNSDDHELTVLLSDDMTRGVLLTKKQ